MRTQPNLLALVALTVACASPPGDDATPMGPPSVDHEDGLADPLDETAPDADPEPETDGDAETDSDSNTDPGPEADPETDTDSDQPDGFTRVSRIDDACDALDPGYGSATDDAVEAIDRTNCYRNLMGLERGLLDPDLDAASQIHADYMDRHDTLTHWEDPSKSLYTGEWVWDRMESAGYPVEPGQSWSEVVAWGTTPTEAVDLWIGSVYHRIPFTMPYWIDAGFGQTGDFSSMSFVTPFPDGPRTAVVFPAHGQDEVPTSFDSDTEIPDPAPSHGVVGYPVTVTAVADSVGSDWSNPYDVELVDAELIGPDGEQVDCLLSDPSTDDHLYVMATMLPVNPLQPDSVYTATMTVRWGGAEETFVSTFRTKR